MKRIVACMVVLTLSGSAGLAALSPMQMLTKAMTLHKGVKDYIAKVSVDIDIPEVEIPHRTATVYVKPPDKMYVDSGGGLVLIPKRALLFGDIAKDIEKEAKVLLIGSKAARGQTIHCLKIVPKEEPQEAKGEEPRILIWVNGTRWTMQRIHIMEGAKVLVSINFTYKHTQGFWMPTKVTCTIPKGTMGSDKPGHISISFSDYKINTGLTDEFFEKKAGGRRGDSPGSNRPRPPRHRRNREQ